MYILDVPARHVWLPEVSDKILNLHPSSCQKKHPSTDSTLEIPFNYHGRQIFIMANPWFFGQGLELFAHDGERVGDGKPLGAEGGLHVRNLSLGAEVSTGP